MDQNIQGHTNLADRCAIAVWMTNVTGERTLVSQQWAWKEDETDTDIRYSHTPAMRSFIYHFDKGCYRELIHEDDDIWNHLNDPYYSHIYDGPDPESPWQMEEEVQRLLIEMLEEIGITGNFEELTIRYARIIVSMLEFKVL